MSTQTKYTFSFSSLVYVFDFNVDLNEKIFIYDVDTQRHTSIEESVHMNKHLPLINGECITEAD